MLACAMTAAMFGYRVMCCRNAAVVRSAGRATGMGAVRPTWAQYAQKIHQLGAVRPRPFLQRVQRTQHHRQLHHSPSPRHAVPESSFPMVAHAAISPSAIAQPDPPSINHDVNLAAPARPTPPSPGAPRRTTIPNPSIQIDPHPSTRHRWKTRSVSSPSSTTKEKKG